MQEGNAAMSAQPAKRKVIEKKTTGLKTKEIGASVDHKKEGRRQKPRTKSPTRKARRAKESESETDRDSSAPSETDQEETPPKEEKTRSRKVKRILKTPVRPVTMGKARL